MIYGVNTSNENGLVKIRYGLKSGRVTSTHQTNFKFLLEYHRPSGNFIDYNGDGLLDIVVTSQYQAYGGNDSKLNFVRIYLNEGTKTAPVFSQEFIKLSAGDVVLCGKSLNENLITVIFPDINSDGKKDMVYLLREDGNELREAENKTKFYYSLNESKDSIMKLGPLKPILYNGVQFKQLCPISIMGSRGCVNLIDTDNDNVKELIINKKGVDYMHGDYERYFLINDGTNLIIEKSISMVSNNISVLKDKLIFKNCEKGSIIKFYTLNGRELYRSRPINSQTLIIDKKILSSGLFIYSIEGEKSNSKGVVSFR